MKLYNLIKTIKDISLSLPNIGSFYTGSVYELNKMQDVEYPAIVLTQEQHTVDVNNETETYGICLFAVDRLTSDDSNREDVQSWANEILLDVIHSLEQLNVIIQPNYTVDVFTERFDSLCAGAFLRAKVEVDIDSCFDERFITEHEFRRFLDLKQDKLIAGRNITIEGNVISATGGGEGGGDVYSDEDNTFTGKNTFNSDVNLNGTTKLNDKDIATEEYVGGIKDELEGMIGDLSDELDNKEDKSNKTTIINEESTDENYPSSKAVYDFTRQYLAFDVRQDSNGFGLLQIQDKYPNTLNGSIMGVFAAGYNNEVGGLGAFVAGSNNKSLGARSTALGQYNIISASKQCSFVTGYNNLVQGNRSTAFGQYSVIGTQGSDFIFGNGTRYNVTVTKIDDTHYSVNNPSDLNKYVLINSGYATTSDGKYIITYTYDEQTNVITTSQALTSNILYVVWSISLGGGGFNAGTNILKGQFAIANGYYNLVKGNQSVAIGSFLNTTKQYEIALGVNNRSNADTIFSIGDGAFADVNNPHNALEIKNDGFVYGNGGKFATDNDIAQVIENQSVVDESQNEIINANSNAIEELQNTVEDLELFKFPNATIFGQPTIQQGQISNFNAANYLEFPFINISQGQPFILDFVFTTNTDITTQQNIINSYFGIAIAVKEGKIILALSSNGSSWDIGNVTGVISVINQNSTYYCRLLFNGTQYILQLSIDGEHYENYITITSNLPVNSTNYYIGSSPVLFSGDPIHPFLGSINFNKCYLSVNDKIVWQGMDSAGIASRLAVNMSNIDNSGIQKVKEIASTLYEWDEDSQTLNINTL